MSGDNSIFTNLNATYHDKVKLGDDTNEAIFNVFFVPDLKTDLLSVSQLLKNGYELFFKDEVHKIKDSKANLIIEAIKT